MTGQETERDKEVYIMSELTFETAKKFIPAITKESFERIKKFIDTYSAERGCSKAEALDALIKYAQIRR